MALNSGTEYSDVVGDTYVTGTVTAGTSALEAKVGGSALSNRELLYIENKGNSVVYYGPSGVTSSTGATLEKGQFVFLNVGQGLSVYLITSSGSSTVVVQEFA